MDIFCDSHEITARFEQYVVDLRRLFVFHSLPCGSAEGFVALGVKLEESKAFRLDVSALLRTIHELAGDRMTAEEMLTILALASGGADLVDGRAETVGLMRTVTLLRVLVAGAGAWSERSVAADDGGGVALGAGVGASAAADDGLAAVPLTRAAIEMSLEELRRQVSEMDRRMHRLEPAAAMDGFAGREVMAGGDGEAAAAVVARVGVNGGAVASEAGMAEPAHEVTRVREVEPGYAEAFESGVVAEYAAAREVPVRFAVPVRALPSRWVLGGVAAAVLVLIGFGVMRLVASMHARTIFAKAAASSSVQTAARIADAPRVESAAKVTDAAAVARVDAAKAQVVAVRPAGVEMRSKRPAEAVRLVVPATVAPVWEKKSKETAHAGGEGTSVAVPAAAVPAVGVKAPAVAVKAPAEEVAGVPGIVRVTQAVMERNLVSSRKPVFPAGALAKGMEGTVVLNTFVAKDGSVSRMDVLSGAPPFIDSAMAAVSWRRYRPYLVGGRPVAVVTPVTVTYRRP